jgi:hypothetical protein
LLSSGSNLPTLPPSQNVPNWDQHTIVGTSQEIFKDYLRLTSVRIAFCPSGLSEGLFWFLGPKA